MCVARSPRFCKVKFAASTVNNKCQKIVKMTVQRMREARQSLFLFFCYPEKEAPRRRSVFYGVWKVPLIWYHKAIFHTAERGNLLCRRFLACVHQLFLEGASVFCDAEHLALIVVFVETHAMDGDSYISSLWRLVLNWINLTKKRVKAHDNVQLSEFSLRDSFHNLLRGCVCETLMKHCANTWLDMTSIHFTHISAHIPVQKLIIWHWPAGCHQWIFFLPNSPHNSKFLPIYARRKSIGKLETIWESSTNWESCLSTWRITIQRCFSKF